jgi:hypothetical protein
LGTAKLLLQHGKHAYQILLDKPQLIVKWRHAIDDFKKGNYQSAKKSFDELNKAFGVEAKNSNEKSKQ